MGYAERVARARRSRINSLAHLHQRLSLFFLVYPIDRRDQAPVNFQDNYGRAHRFRHYLSQGRDDFELERGSYASVFHHTLGHCLRASIGLCASENLQDEEVSIPA